MQPMTEKQLSKWKQTRSHGRGRYILLSGILGWGIPTAILFSLILCRFKPGIDQFILRLVISLVIFPIGGYFFGSAMWRLSEKRYAVSVPPNRSAFK
jgi:hypothetical protein